MADREYASKGVAGTGLGLGIAGVATGVPAMITSIINLINEGKKDKAEQMAVANGINIAEVIAMIGLMNDKKEDKGYGPYGYGPGFAPYGYGPNFGPCGPGFGGYGFNDGYGRDHGRHFQDAPATHYELDNAKLLAEKESIIANLKADNRTDDKLLELNAFYDNKFNEVNKVLAENAVASAVANTKAEYLNQEVKENSHAIVGLTKALGDQAVYNGINTERLSCIGRQVVGLERSFDSLTEIMIPQRHVSPTQPVAVQPILQPVPATNIATTLAAMEASLATIAGEFD